jgi:hypothetical protein
VDETAVKTGVAVLSVSSAACTAEARLTTPAAANPIVHLSNFIWFLHIVVVSARAQGVQTDGLEGKNGLPRHLPGAFAGIDKGKPVGLTTVFFIFLPLNPVATAFLIGAPS